MRLPTVRCDEAKAFLRSMKTECAHAIVTDPPAGFGYQSREWDGDKRELIAGYRQSLVDLGVPESRVDVLMRQWLPSAWTLWFRDVCHEMRRVLVPGGWVLCWSTPKTSHWTAQGLELAGFRVVDNIAWLYSTGMPKNTNVAWHVDRVLGVSRKSTQPPVTPEAQEVAGRGTVLAPAREDWILAQKPTDGTLADAWLRYRSATLSIDDCRIENPAENPDENPGAKIPNAKSRGQNPGPQNPGGPAANRPAGQISDSRVTIPTHASENRPAGRKTDAPVGTVQVGPEPTSSTNVGRWPKNTFIGGDVPHVLAGKARFYYCPKVKTGSHETEAGCEDLPLTPGSDMVRRKAGSDGLRNGRAGRGRSSKGARNDHPTVKPLELCRHLVRLVTTEGQVVVDPFCGSGSLLVAAMIEGRRAVGCDLDPRYVEVSRRRAAHWAEHPSPSVVSRDPSGPRVETVREAGPMTRCVVKLPAELHRAISRWPDSLGATYRAALDHWFGVIRDPGGPVIPAGYLAGYNLGDVTLGRSIDVLLFADQAHILRELDALAPTVRQSLLAWLGHSGEVPGDRDKAAERWAFRGSEDPRC